MNVIRSHDSEFLQTLQLTLAEVNYTDYVLLLAIVLASSYIYNRGSILPKIDPFRDLYFEAPQKRDGTSNCVSPVTRDIGAKAQDLGATLAILWGSQSGTAEALAHRLARDIQQRLKSISIVGDMADYDPATLAKIPGQVKVLFIMSTYGEGDPSDNAQDFVSYVTGLSDSSLSHLQYAGFGCGNSNYRYFNKVIDDIALALERCGAQQILPTGKGDEAARSTQEDFLEWKENLFSVLVDQYGLSDHEAEYQPTIDIVKESQVSADSEAKSGSGTIRKNKRIQLPVVSKDTIASYDEQSRTCIDLKLGLSRHAQVKYRTGDHIAIWPKSPTEEVSRLLQVLGLESQKNDRLRITLKHEFDELKIPSSTTLHDLFLQHLDICAPVPRETVRALSQLSLSLKVKQELSRIGSSREAYAEFLDCNHLTLARLLEMMNTLEPSNTWSSLPLAFIIDFVPAMQPRLYSISSSNTVDPRHIGIVVSVKPTAIKYRPDSMIQGLASTDLSRTPAHSSETRIMESVVHAEIRRSSFKLPLNLKTPVIMVAAGTGIAPFRAFVQERARLASIGHDVGAMILFFGSQNTSDCLYFDEFSEMASKSGPSSPHLQYITAFSRPRGSAVDSSRKKMYVQDQVLLHRQEIIQQMLEKDAALYICGATTMAKAVGDVILKGVMESTDWSNSEADKWRQQKKKSGRWNEDVWG